MTKDEAAIGLRKFGTDQLAYLIAKFPDGVLASLARAELSRRYRQRNIPLQSSGTNDEYLEYLDQTESKIPE